MSDTTVASLLQSSSSWMPASVRKTGGILMVLGAVGLVLGFLATGDTRAGFSVLLTAAVLILGIAMVGPLLSAIFEMTGAKWGRPYRRLAEGTIALMPVAVIVILVLVASGNAYLPWVFEPPRHGGKHIWLSRGFWDARVIGAMLIAYAVGISFVRLSIRRDFCEEAVSEKFTGILKRLFAANIKDPKKEKTRISESMARLAPVVAVVYALCFSLLGFDLIMALEPEWYSTLFGAWYFIGNLFSGLAITAILAVAISRSPGMDRFFTETRQSDMATLLLAFCLINGDFFWNQYLTIWYANLPEETFYLMKRTEDFAGMPWRGLSFVSLAAFFFIPFTALLLRKVKKSRIILTSVASIAVLGVLIARFVEIAPALVQEESGVPGFLSAAAALMVFIGLLGAGLLVFSKLFADVPILCVGDEILLNVVSDKEAHG